MDNPVAVVVIGRNEGERLRICLESLRGHCVVYVDSGSTDGSVALAQTMGARVLALNLSHPFSAARGRNAGYEFLAPARSPHNGRSPGIAIPGPTPPNYVQFVDGDCELTPGWLEAARDYLDTHDDVAAVTGVLRERFPEASIYNRMCDMEWQGPAGEIAECGGLAMYRHAAFAAVGGFDASIRAGEEPELCLRLREKGWKIVRIDHAMAMHDAALLHFRPWWRRVVRGGEAAIDISTRTHGRVRVFADMVRRATIWGIVLPLLWLGGTIVPAMAGRLDISLVCGTLGAALFVLQAARFARRGLHTGLWRGDALAYGVLCVLVKFGEAWGIIRWRIGRLTKRRAASNGKQFYEKSPPALSAAPHPRSTDPHVNRMPLPLP